MRKKWDEAKAYKIIGIAEILLSFVLTGLFMFLIFTCEETMASNSAISSLAIVLGFGLLTFSTGLWFVSHKPNNEENKENKYL